MPFITDRERRDTAVNHASDMTMQWKHVALLFLLVCKILKQFSVENTQKDICYYAVYSGHYFI
jgi:hypothetical protein